MTKKVLCMILLTGVFTAVSFPIFAESKQNRDLAEQLLIVKKEKENSEQTLSIIRQMLSKESATKSWAGEFVKMIDQETSWDKVKEYYIDAYAETFSEKEMKDMIAFYNTPSGKALVQKTPEISRKLGTMMEKIMGQLKPKIQAFILEKLKEDSKNRTEKK